VMGPVLDQVADATDLVVVAGGLLGLLPLHAAWTADRRRVTGRRYVLDTLPVSYVPNARALSAARGLAGQVPPTRLLAMADPWPVAAAALPMAKYEATTAAAAFPEASTVLQRGEATFLSFEWEATKADVLHLACHGFAALTRPLDSGLVLAGGQITLGRLMELQLRVRLAVLSACETAQPGTELPDEVVALPTGLLQAGVAGIVASVVGARPGHGHADGGVLPVLAVGRGDARGRPARRPALAARHHDRREARSLSRRAQRSGRLAAARCRPGVP